MNDMNVPGKQPRRHRRLLLRRRTLGGGEVEGDVDVD